MNKRNAQTSLLSCVLTCGVLLGACVGHHPVRVEAAETPTPVARPDRPSRADFHCLAMNMYWEARGEGRRGMLAVGWVVLNRVRSSEFPATICAVVYQGGEQPPCQFSWWCDGRSDRPREHESWQAALAVAAELLSDPPPDVTNNALFYHAASIRNPWTRPRTRTAQIGDHIFYR